MKLFKLEEVGGETWCRQHERLEKLNMQSIISARLLENEFVKEFLINHDRYPILVYDLLVIELWKERVYEEIKRLQYQPSSSFVLYTILYHEATLVNLLECTLYHADSIETLQDSALDLEDYCYRKLTRLITFTESSEESQQAEQPLNSTLSELETQCRNMEHDISIRCISIVQYMVEHASLLHATVIDRLLRVHDVPILFVELVECAPWYKQENGVSYKFIDGKWHDEQKLASDGAEGGTLSLPKCEVQCWLALFNLLLSERLRGKYELNSYRKGIIMKLRSKLATQRELLDAVPTMTSLIEYLDKLSIYEPQSSRSELILEQLPQIRDALIGSADEYARSHKTDNAYRHIAQLCIDEYLTIDEAELRRRATEWTAMYDTDVMEKALFNEPPRCVFCGALAKNRCSRCRNEWYCKRECQVKHWPKHKKACELLAQAVSASDSKQS